MLTTEEPVRLDNEAFRRIVTLGSSLRLAYTYSPVARLGITAAFDAARLQQNYKIPSLLFGTFCLSPGGFAPIEAWEATVLNYNVNTNAFGIAFGIHYRLPTVSRMHFTVGGSIGTAKFDKVIDNYAYLRVCANIVPGLNVSTVTHSRYVCAELAVFYPCNNHWALQGQLSATYYARELNKDNIESNEPMVGIRAPVLSARWYSIGPSLGLSYSFGKAR